MREHKVVVLGGMGSGKSTLVRSIAAGAVIDTDVANSDRLGADKASTTVALDYADIDLPNGERLRLYGTPGQQRFDFLWPILLQGHVVRCCCWTRAVPGWPASWRTTCRCCSRSQRHWRWWWRSPISTSAARCAGRLGCTRQLDDQPLPLLAVDARDREQGLLLMDVLMSEMEAHALVAAHG